MSLPRISRVALQAAATQPGGILYLVVEKTWGEALGCTDAPHELTAEAMQRLTAAQITLLAYDILRRELMEGGYVQLIHNGYGPFFFLNPFAKAMRLWGLKELQNDVYAARRLYEKYGSEIERDCSDEEFMALYERFEYFDELDDRFQDCEPQYTAAIAEYVEANKGDFLEETE